MPKPPEKFNVGGVLLDRPFKICRPGHFGFNLVNMADGLRFYTDLLGFRVSDVIDDATRARRLSAGEKTKNAGQKNGVRIDEVT